MDRFIDAVDVYPLKKKKKRKLNHSLKYEIKYKTYTHHLHPQPGT